MQQIKKSVLVGASVLTLGVGGLGVVGVANADTTTSTNGESSLVDKIASKFNLDKSKVQAVFDEEHQAREAEMKQNRTDALKQAVTDGKLTQSQAAHITAAWKEIDAIRDSASSPKDLTDAQRTEIKTKLDALRTWAEDQNLDLRGIIGGPGHGHGGFGGPRDGGDVSGATSAS